MGQGIKSRNINIFSYSILSFHISPDLKDLSTSMLFHITKRSPDSNNSHSWISILIFLPFKCLNPRLTWQWYPFSHWGFRKDNNQRVNLKKKKKRQSHQSKMSLLMHKLLVCFMVCHWCKRNIYSPRRRNRNWLTRSAVLHDRRC